MAITKLDNEKVAYIYGLKEKDADTYFYVGSTKFQPEKRLKSHIYNIKHKLHLNKHFMNKVKKIGFDNVFLDVLQTTTKERRWMVEKQWIELLVKKGHQLVNRIHNGINYQIKNDKFAENEYYKISHFLDSPLFNPSNNFHLTAKACVEYMQRSGNLLEEYFDS